MATLVFDIETAGEKWSDIDEHTQDVLTRWIRRTAKNETDRKVLLARAQDELGLSPFTGEIIALGLYDIERAQGVVYFQSNEKDIEFAEGNIVFRTRSEKEMLEDFWEGAESYDTFVTYNGRGFDVPFINIRSAAHKVRPTQALLAHRYLNTQENIYHVDLQDQLSYYGATPRRPSLHLACRTLGIESPKLNGVNGADISQLFYDGRFRKIARYNAGDVRATTELYQEWLRYLAPHSFINRIV